MEWVETTGRSVQEAKEAALDELGVDEAEAEFEVIADAQTGLFGRLRSEARVRARVRPTAPRAKDDHRNRDRRRRAGVQGKPAADTAAGPSSRSDAATSSASATGAAESSSTARRAAVAAAEEAAVAATVTGSPSTPPAAEVSADGREETAGEEAGGGAGRKPRRNRRRGDRRPGAAPSQQDRASADRAGDDDDRSAKGTEVDVDLDRQAEVAADFLTKLVAEFGLDATVTVARPDDDTVEVQLTGPDLGILIGPKGSTLLAVQNLTRTVVFNETGGSNGHINVDVAGYRQKRTEALIRFSRQVAEQVKTSGNRTALEPMSAVDRKIVHDTIAAIDGVTTTSEGEEPRRRVVVLPG